MGLPDDEVFYLTGQTADPNRYNTRNRLPMESTMMIVERIPVGARVLDIGCGIGAISEAVALLRNANVVAIEPDPIRANTAAEAGIDVHCGYLDQRLLSSLGKFDVLIMADVLEHIASPSSMLLLAKQAISPGGRLIISVPNVAHWSVRLSLLFGKFNYSVFGLLDATHVRWFTKDSLVRYLTRLGFTIHEVAPTAGVQLSVYRRFPFSWLPTRLRRALVRCFAKYWPSLWGCQFILSAGADAPNVGRV